MSTSTKPKYRCEIAKLTNQPVWRTFYYCPGAGFNCGSEVYYGRNDWSTHESALAAKTEWESRNQ